MLWVQIPLEATLFFKDTSMHILYKNARNVRFVLFTKTSIAAKNFYVMWTEKKNFHCLRFQWKVIISQIRWQINF